MQIFRVRPFFKLLNSAYMVFNSEKLNVGYLSYQKQVSSLHFIYEYLTVV